MRFAIFTERPVSRWRLPVALVLVVLVGPPTLARAASFPRPAAEYLPPTGAPTAPGNAFGLSFSDSVIANAPVIAAWNESTRPGESLTLTGIRFTTENGARANQNTTVWISDGSTFIQLTVIKATPTMLTVSIPAHISYGMYFLWVGNAEGMSLPVAINRTNAQWIGPLGNTATAGSVKRVFGKDLSTDHGTTKSYVYLQSPAGGSFVAATVTNVEPYAVTFQVPARLANGNYNVFVHNGHGGGYGWGAPLPLTITTPFVRGSGVIVLSPSGGDDAPAIQAALNTQGGPANGGTVRLSAGTFIINRELSARANVELQGAGKDRTTIRTEFVGSPPEAIQILGNNVEIRGINWQLYSGAPPVYQVISTRPHPSPWQNIKLDDIRISANDPATATWGNINGMVATGMEISNSEFYRELGLTGSDQWVHNNVFHGGTYLGNEAGSDGAINFQYLNRTVIEANTIQTPSWSATPAYGSNIARRVMYGSVNGASTVNLYIAHNTGTDVAPGPGENKGELFLFHGGSAPWYGQVVSNAGTRMTVRTDGLINGQSLPNIYNYSGSYPYRGTTYSGVLSDPLTAVGNEHDVVNPSHYGGRVGMFAAIVGGTGIGQIRQATGVTENTITVASVWRVPPDSTSKVVLLDVYKDILIYDNNIAAFPTSAIGTTANSGASALIVFDGNCWSSVADSNISQRTYGGGSVGAAPLTQSMWNNFQDNQFLALRETGMFVVNTENTPGNTTSQMIGPVTLGNVFRGNTIQITGPQYAVQNPDFSVYQLGTVGGDFAGQNSLYPYPFHLANIFENNTATGGRRGIFAGDWGDTVYRNNNLAVDSSETATPSAAFTPQPFYIGEHATVDLIDNTYSVARAGSLSRGTGRPR